MRSFRLPIPPSAAGAAARGAVALLAATLSACVPSIPRKPPSTASSPVAERFETEHSRLTSLERAPPESERIRTLVIRASCDREIATLTLPGWMSTLSRLETLILGSAPEEGFRQDCDLRVRPPRDLTGLASLRRLFLDDPFGPEGPSIVQELRLPTTLTDLAVHGIPLESAPGWLASQPELRRLTLVRLGLTSLPASLTRLRELERLDLRGNRLRDLPPGLERLPKLRLIRLGDNGMPRRSKEALGRRFAAGLLDFTDAFDGAGENGD